MGALVPTQEVKRAREFESCESCLSHCTPRLNGTGRNSPARKVSPKRVAQLDKELPQSVVQKYALPSLREIQVRRLSYQEVMEQELLGQKFQGMVDEGFHIVPVKTRTGDVEMLLVVPINRLIVTVKSGVADTSRTVQDAVRKKAWVLVSKNNKLVLAQPDEICTLCGYKDAGQSLRNLVVSKASSMLEVRAHFISMMELWQAVDEGEEGCVGAEGVSEDDEDISGDEEDISEDEEDISEDEQKDSVRPLLNPTEPADDVRELTIPLMFKPLVLNVFDIFFTPTSDYRPTSNGTMVQIMPSTNNEGVNNASSALLNGLSPALSGLEGPHREEGQVSDRLDQPGIAMENEAVEGMMRLDPTRGQSDHTGQPS